MALKNEMTEIKSIRVIQKYISASGRISKLEGIFKITESEKGMETREQVRECVTPRSRSTHAEETEREGPGRRFEEVTTQDSQVR